ncbi:MAG: DUF4124 domain-containing protein [Burkholderiales bacterium]|nr:DUF4124 domain-containing protein [Burkholderiales bacterium]
MQKNIATLVSSLIFALMATATAQAQYVWLNDKGIKQYSDTPPPRSVPADRIIKSPGGKSANSTHASPSSTTPATETSGKSELAKIEKPKTLANKIEDFNKRKIAKEEAEKKEEAEQQNKEVKAKNCERAKNYKQSLDEGGLIMTRSKEGERIPMDEAQRNKEMQEAKKVLEECKQQ